MYVLNELCEFVCLHFAMWICMSSFWLISFFIFSTLWFIGTDWKHQFGGRLITLCTSSRRTRNRIWQRAIAVMSLVCSFYCKTHRWSTAPFCLKQWILWCWQSWPVLLMNAALPTLPTCMGKSRRPLLVLLLNCWQSIFSLFVGLITHPSHFLLLIPVIFLMRSI